MSPEMKAQLRELLIKHEKWEKYPYVDSVGKITIGVGYNLTDRGMPDSFINAQLNQDIEYFYNQLDNHFPWFKSLNEARQMALVDMSFMGFKTFCGFIYLIDALSKLDYFRAAKEIINSKWAEQVGKLPGQRAHTIAQIIDSGLWMVTP